MFYYFREIPFFSEGERECYEASSFRKLDTHNFTNKLTKMLANKGIVTEGIEIIRTRELID
jgi:hypothetical protein